MTLKDNMYKQMIIAASCLSLMIVANAQDFTFSQYQQTPMSINPAISADIDNIKIIVNYHQNKLWETLDMQNYQLSVLYPLNITNNERTPQGLGLSLMHDNTGNQGLISCTGGSLGFSQGVRISNATLLSAGFLASYYLFNNTFSGNYTTGSQWINGYGFNQSVGIDEQINFETLRLFSISAGVNLNIRDKSTSKGDMGLAIYHLNKPQYSFLKEGNNRLNTKYIIYANYRLIRVHEITLSPRVLFIYQKINKLSLGTLINYAFKSDNPFLLVRDCNLQLGLDYRNDHSGVISFNIEQSRYILGLSYATGLNSREVYNRYKSNFEVLLALKLNKHKKHARTEYTIGDTRLFFNKGIDRQPIVEHAVADNYHSDSVVVNGEKYQLNLRQDFKFKFNDATLSPENYPYLNDLVTMLEQNPHLKVEVIGHTDDVGTDEANQIVSERRAKVVVDYLISKGIKPYRLKLTFKGKTEPLAPNDNEENRAKNRRVEFKIYNE